MLKCVNVNGGRLVARSDDDYFEGRRLQRAAMTAAEHAIAIQHQYLGPKTTVPLTIIVSQTA